MGARGRMLRLIWFPTWSCQFYSANQSHGKNCPYCPLGLGATLDGKSAVLFEGKPTSPNKLAEPDRIIAFLRKNREILKETVHLSGGEPLLYPHLSDVLWDTGFYWSITSNSQHRPAIDKLAPVMKNCVGWTCSYHPLAEKEEVYAQNLNHVARYVRNLRATLVISHQTLPVLDRAVRFMLTLPLAGHQYHWDSHPTDGADTEAMKIEAGKILRKYEFNPMIYAGEVPQGMMCDRFGVGLALSPAGHLHECVTKLHLDQDRLCEVDGETSLLSFLAREDRVQRCDVPCFACCDHVKHVGKA